LSQAAPAIWKNWDDFVVKSTAFEAAIEVLDVSDLAALRGGMRAIGGGCMACHKSYKTD
jgi:cytochrome c556